MIRGDREYRREKLGIGRPSASQYGASQYCAPTSSKKWTPGIYHEVSAMGSSRAGEWNAVKNRMTDNDDGAMFRFTWMELEKDTLGNYQPGFNLVQDYLDQCADLNKQFMMFVQVKSFGGDSVPKYMKNSTKYADGKNYSGCQNGQYIYESSNGGNGGTVPNLHIDAVKERFQELLKAYADKFNDHPNFECLVLSEASLAKPKGCPDPWTDETKIYNKYAQALVYAKEFWSNSQICQWVNSPRNQMENMVPQLLEVGIGVGMTDLGFEDRAFNYRSDVPNSQPRGNIEWCEIASGKAIVMGHFSKPAYAGEVIARGQVSGTIQNEPHVFPTYPGNAKTRQQTFDLAVNKAKCSHIVFIHNSSSQPHAGDEDNSAPASANPYKATSDEWSGNYAGKSYNVVTDNFLAGSENLGTQHLKPDNWD
jgi:hypothetical protein